MDDKCRLFVALPVPDSLKQIAARLPRKGLDARWTAPDDLHITIRFLGDVEPGNIPAIEQALSRVRRAPFYVDVRGLGVFENDRQTVFYANVESTRKLTALCADITDVLTPLGFDFGTRPFIPHVTLARTGGGDLDAYIKRHEKQVVAHWQACDFALMQSAKSNEKGRYYNLLSIHPLVL
jgi:2'-5' RNA ligase